MRKNILLGSILIFSVIFQSTAWSMVVFDPTNFSKNIITATQSVKTTAQLVLQQKTMVDQYMTMLQNVKNLPSTTVQSVIQRGVSQGVITGVGYPNTDVNGALNEARGVYGTYSDIYTTMGGLSSTYDQLGSYTTNMNRLSAASGLSWDSMLATELRAAQQGQTASAQQYLSLQNLTSQLGNFQSRADALATQIPANNGALEALSTMSAQNHLMSDQMSGLLQSSLAQSQFAAINQREAAMQKQKDVINSQSTDDRQKQINKYFGVPAAQ